MRLFWITASILLLLLAAFPALANGPDSLTVLPEKASDDGPFSFDPRIAFMGTLSDEHGPEYDLGASIRWVRWEAFASEVGVTIGTRAEEHFIQNAFLAVVGNLGSLEDYGVDVRVIKRLGLSVGAFAAIDWNLDGDSDEAKTEDARYEFDFGAYVSVLDLSW